ncbi:hypothetical protein COLO4_28224 [Corchorus olitorius]|uniref:Uncharacterized protein n=1 Tax=Corchorus olitorius TaxID=93759 RepID=A0A1R3HMH6_9ROSI|nr:hypothetical protein COLO4_28224 [Corchorus olitorius]
MSLRREGKQSWSGAQSREIRILKRKVGGKLLAHRAMLGQMRGSP